ncbi:MAG: HU family DNA-binding protein [Muribaculaceae bacterium]|nr:HU family DNA-binding protein [Muribaculaceae bacterium]MDE6644238.1 HU family DNA-binding protein [Muribaculaceae bacterium]MDE7091870.1 HU family DNA-binding protein [Muribaculaceae bacterium]
MDSKDFVNIFAKKSGLDVKSATDAIEAITSTITDTLVAMDSVAIPSFGTFECIKKDETVTRDIATNKRVLLPPSIEVKFKPATALSNSIKE